MSGPRRAAVDLQLRTCDLCGNVAPTLRAAVAHANRCRVEQRPSAINVPDDDADIQAWQQLHAGGSEDEQPEQPALQRPQRPLPIPFSAGRLPARRPAAAAGQENRAAGAREGEETLEDIVHAHQEALHRDRLLGGAEDVFKLFGSSWCAQCAAISCSTNSVY